MHGIRITPMKDFALELQNTCNRHWARIIYFSKAGVFVFHSIGPWGMHFHGM